VIPSQLRLRREDGETLPYLVWRLSEPLLVASTASSGGGVGERSWLINAQVAHSYARLDLDAHADELAAASGLVGIGTTMFTAADVRKPGRASDGGVRVEATVGLSHPTWAAAPDEPARPTVGTINIVAWLPVRLTVAALLGALCTATEAKTQALFELGVPATGTPSDAVTVVCPGLGSEPFCGVRSVWGARLARAVQGALTPPRRWS
jgi:adenosylcobinamide amidohydrolase